MKLFPAAALLVAAAALCSFALVDAANCSAIATNQYCIYCRRDGRRYVCLPDGGTPCTSGTTTIQRCKDVLDKAGRLRADGCYEGMVVEAEPAIFRARNSTLPAGGGYSQCTSYTIAGVRLVGGPNPNAGPVEVRVGGYWGNVVLLYDRPDAAKVVCRHLGKKGGTARPYAYYGPGQQGLMVEDIYCYTGNEPNISSCGVSFNYDFTMKRDLVWGVECTDPAAPLPDCSAVPANRYCSYCNSTGAYMVCLAQGGITCRSGGRIIKPCLDSGVVPSTRTNNGGCLEELFASPASWAYFRGVHSAPPTGQGLNCFAHTVTAVRLVNGSNAAEGRLEVQMGGFWGTVSAKLYGMGDNVAKVVCRQLGMKGGIAYPHAPFGPNRRLGVLLSEAFCPSGKEASLNDCSIMSPAGDGGIGHEADVGVACVEPAKFPKCASLSGNVYCVACSLYGARHVCLASGAPCLADGQVVRLCSQVATVPTPSGNGCPLYYTINGIHSFRSRHTSWPKSGSPNCYDTAVTDLRLVGGPNPNAGRLEVRIDGKWGTVCSQPYGSASFDDKAAKVACRQMGKPGGLAHSYAFYGRGAPDMPVFMDGVSCDGSEKNLSACGFSTFSNCDHGEDVAVECVDPAALPKCSTLPANRYCVSCSASFMGRRHVCLASGGTTCKTNSGVVIRPCQDVVSSPDRNHSPQGCYLYYDLKTAPGVTYGFRTKQASLPTDSSTDCTSKKVTGIRLVRGPTTPANAGRVEVQIHGAWGSVCAQSFGVNEAKVACRQLGKKGGVPHSYSRYGAAPAGTPALITFGSSSYCIGNEASLTQCPYQFSTDTCGTEGEAGLECAA